METAKRLTGQVAMFVTELRDSYRTLTPVTPDIAQVVGLVCDGRPLTLVNVIPNIASRSKTSFWFWHDGGPQIFQLLIDPAEQRLIRWHFNGGY